MVEKLLSLPKPKLSLSPPPIFPIPTTPHHSSSDWDKSHTNWQISTLLYVSAPSSLLIHYVSGTPRTIFLCRDSDVLHLPQGQIITYCHMRHSLFYAYLYFRNTAPLGTATRTNCYELYFRPTGGWTLRELANNVVVRFWNRDATSFTTGTWHQHRVTWWLSWDLLIVKYERKINGDWTQQGDVVSIENSLHGEEEIQRCGLAAYVTQAPYNTSWDDFEIWDITE